MKRKIVFIISLFFMFTQFATTCLAEQTSAKDDFISDIIATAEQLFTNANGRLQRAQYSGDIYICKNFTVYLFNQNSTKYRMSEFPDVDLIIPANLPSDDCAPYYYGIEWKNISASEGNPFEIAASFRYDNNISEEENRENARMFMMNVQKGDYFQMSANYYYGVGAHSLVFIENYDPETQTVHWTDSNMKGEKKNGERYGLVQFDAKKEIDWFVDAFCQSKRGATLYRLRDDIILAD